MKLYATEQGLSSEVVAAMVQDRDGVIWAGTDAGLHFFNGRSFQILPMDLPSAVVWDLFADADGALWVATRNGLIRIRGSQSTPFGPDQGLPKGQANRVARDARGRMWVLGAGGLHVLEGDQRFVPAPPLPEPAPVTQMYAHPSLESVWAIAGPRLWRLDGSGRWVAEPVPAMGPQETAVGFAVDGSGQWWLRTSIRLWRKPAGGDWALVRPHVEGGATVYSKFDRDAAGWVWFEDKAGLWRAQGSREEWFAPPSLEGRGALVDAEGGIWLRAHRGVARVLGKTRWRTFGPPEGMASSVVWRVLRDRRGYLWAGTDLGLDRFDGVRWKTILHARTIWVVPGRGDEIWAGGSPGGTVHRIDLATLRVETLRVDALPVARIVASLAVDAEGRPWVADLEEGLARGELRNGRWSWEKLLIAGREAKQVNWILPAPEGRMIVAYQGGVAVHHAGTWEVVPGTADSLPVAVALGPAQELAVAYMDHALVTVHHLEGGHYQRGSLLRLFQAAPQTALFSIAYEPSGFLWVGTSLCAARLDPAHPEGIQSFFGPDGLASTDCNQGSLTVEGGRVWIGTSQGLSLFRGDPDAPREPLRAPRIYAVRTGDKPLAFQDGPARLPPGARDLDLFFLVPTYQARGNISTQAWLEGVDSRWVDLEAGHVRYPGLRPGSYTLRLRGTLGPTSPGPEEVFRFQVLPRWWESVPAMTAYGLMFVFGAYGLFRYLEGRLVARNRELQDAVDRQTRTLLSASQAKSSFVANLSHELRTPLNAMILYSDLVMAEAEGIDAQTIVADTGKIQVAGRHLLNLINDVLDLSRIEAGKIEFHPQTFRLDKLVEELEGTARPLVERGGNALALELRTAPETLRADPLRIRQVLFNLLANAARFTRAGTITLRIARGGERIHFEVSDTGVGMTRDEMSQLFREFAQVGSDAARSGGTGLGLVLVRHLTELMGGTVQVESEPGKGSLFRVTLPYLET